MTALVRRLPSRPLLTDQKLLASAAAAAAAVATIVVGLATLNLRTQQVEVPHRAGGVSATSQEEVTDISISDEVLHGNVKRFGINLSGQTFYDSGQLMKNLIFRNPGFEGETWQSFLHCKTADANTCIDDNPYSPWPTGFLDGAEYEVISGRRAGATGRIDTSSRASGGDGNKLLLEKPARGLQAGDFLLVRMHKPGDAAAGWWTSSSGGATISTEFHDLAPDSPGQQALRVEAAGLDQFASVSSFFDSTEERSFLRLQGRFTLHFRAKWLRGSSHAIPVSLSRFNKASHQSHGFLEEDVPLAPEWREYTRSFSAEEDGSAPGTLALTFATQNNAFLLDDVSLTPEDTPANRTAFRDEVVETLREVNPGILRFMDNGTSFGSTLDDLLAPPFARRRGGWHLTSARAEDIPMGLHESLVLAAAIHTEPWYTLPGTFSPSEMSHLIEYLAGPSTTPYGLKRKSLGQAAPWTKVFKSIHLEFGNEMWNAGDFGGEALPSPAVYAARTSALFSAARVSPYFDRIHFDLIAGAQAGNTWLTTQLLNTDLHADSIDFAPYLFSQLNDVSSEEAVFGAMFSMPEQQDEPMARAAEGIMAQQVRAVHESSHPLSPAVYEVNLSTNSSDVDSITQQQIDQIVPSIGGGIAVADHMLLMLRDLGITSQCLFSLPQYVNRFSQPGNANKTTPLWGSVIDMGGPTNLRRPTYLALQLVNRAVLANEVKTSLSGANPTWDQPASLNGPTPATRAHLLQTFAFADGPRRSLILLNLSRTGTLPVTFSGANSPSGVITETRLTSRNITDSNEQQPIVRPVTRTLTTFKPTARYSLPPFSMTVLSWERMQ